MKFSDGYALRPGVKPLFPWRILEYSTQDNELIIRGLDRADPRGFDGRIITVRISSPEDNVVRVQASHFWQHQKKVVFPLDYGRKGKNVSIEDKGEAIVFTTGDVSVRLQKEPWRMEFLSGGKRITGSMGGSLGMMDTDNGPFMIERLDLGVGECIYGMGERFGPFVKNGQSVVIWNDDSSTATELAYKNVPFYMSSAGYGLLINSPGKVEYEVATEKVEKIQFSVPGQMLDYYLFYGPTPKKVLDRYTGFSGRPALPPAWSFGLWLTTSFTTDYNEETINEFVDGMLDRGIPLKVFHFDCFWMKERNWCDFIWDTNNFPDPKAMLSRLKAKGLKICVWINPYISELSAIFPEGAEKGYFLKTKDGGVFQADEWQPGMALVDFTNPEDVAWYKGMLRALVEMGVDCFKTDFGERIPDTAVYFGGSDPKLMHNFYTYLYNKAVFEVLEEYYGKGNAVLFARSATACSQQFPVHWGGDTTASFASMAETMRAGLSFMSSGFTFWSHDIGGFNAMPTPALFQRWIQFGLMSSHSRLHGAESYRVPWLFGEESVDVTRDFTRMKNRLMPYIYGAAVDAHTFGWPVMRPMPLEFPEDPGSKYIDTQFMLGSSILVAPVFTEEGDATFYLPPGRWTNFFTGEVVDGSRWIKENIKASEMPLYVRDNTVLPMTATEDTPDYDFQDGVVLNLFEISDGANISIRIPSRDGSSISKVTCTRSGGEITVKTDGKLTNWSVVLRGVHSLASVKGGSAGSKTAEGTTVTPDAGASELTLAV